MHGPLQKYLVTVRPFETSRKVIDILDDLGIFFVSISAMRFEVWSTLPRNRVGPNVMARLFPPEWITPFKGGRCYATVKKLPMSQAERDDRKMLIEMHDILRVWDIDTGEDGILAVEYPIPDRILFIEQNQLGAFPFADKDTENEEN